MAHTRVVALVEFQANLAQHKIGIAFILKLRPNENAIFCYCTFFYLFKNMMEFHSFQII